MAKQKKRQRHAGELALRSPQGEAGTPATRAAARRAARPNVIVTNSQKAVRISQAVLSQLVDLVGRREGQKLAQVEIALVNSDEIAYYNRRYLQHAGPTDVLSFDLSEGGAGIIGQLIICGEVAARQGRWRGHSARKELMLYVVHGLLHLMGYEDHTIRGAARMHAREDEILAEFGAGQVFARPVKKR